MRRSKLQLRLEEGQQVAGVFAPAHSPELATAGVLTWSSEHGAELELVDLSDPWPTDFGEVFTVHGQPHEGDEVTLLEARVHTQTAFGRTSRIGSWALALGDHVDVDDRWPIANYRPATLHEWLPETGLSINKGEDASRLVVEWDAPPRRTVAVPDGEVAINPGASWSWSYSPSWSIDTSMTFSVRSMEPLTIREHGERFGNPLLSFSIFAADEPDGLLRESYYDPDRERGVLILRPGRPAVQRDWRPNAGRFLFQAADVDVATALSSWFEIWHKTFPSLGLFRETIEQGTSYSAPRFLTLYTAAEGYWKNVKGGKAGWSPRELAKRAGVSSQVTGATDQAVALIGATRNYHAHLNVSSQFTPATIVDQTFESTRRLHALLQACLLRDIGLETGDIERLMDDHYRSWPVP